MPWLAASELDQLVAGAGKLLGTGSETSPLDTWTAPADERRVCARRVTRHVPS